MKKILIILIGILLVSSISCIAVLSNKNVGVNKEVKNILDEYNMTNNIISKTYELDNGKVERKLYCYSCYELGESIDCGVRIQTKKVFDNINDADDWEKERINMIANQLIKDKTKTKELVSEEKIIILEEK